MKIQKIQTDTAPAAIGPYSQAILAGDILFASGQIPINPQSGEIPEELEGQARQVFENILGVLGEAGLSFQNIVKTTVFLKNFDDFSLMNQIYSEFFSAPYPARSCVEVARLPKDVLIEIEFIAVKQV